MQITITKENKPKVLAALFNGSQAQGMGFLQNHAPEMSETEAEELLKGDPYFDYVRGRVMKINLKGETFSTHLYDRDNGIGEAHRILDSLNLVGSYEE